VSARIGAEARARSKAVAREERLELRHEKAEKTEVKHCCCCCCCRRHRYGLPVCAVDWMPPW
jgi:hypothetical protein